MARVVHFELFADDPERAVKFYEGVFGWKIQKWEGPGDYWLISTGDQGTPGIDGGLGKREDPGMKSLSVVDVSDLDSSIQAIETNGGAITVPKMAVPGVGWLSYAKDTEGNPFGMMQSDPEAR